MEIFPSLISSDLLNLEKTVNILEPFVDGFHIDIMDDHFVPNLTWGAMFVDSIVDVTEKPLHVHLMVDCPEKWPSILSLRQRDSIIFHYESFMFKNNLIKRFIDTIKNKNIMVGIAINPETIEDKIFDFLPELDNVLLMSVNPGFSGQKFISSVKNKIIPIFEFREKNKFRFKIGIDGGIDKTNIECLLDLGVDQFSIASAIFDKKNWVGAIQELKK